MIPSPDRTRLQHMIDAALPGGRVVSIRRLRGGLCAHMHAVAVALRDGARTRVVLRRPGPEGHLQTPEQAVAEHGTLVVLGEAGVPAPRPLLLDAEGRYFGGPSILMSYEGRPLVSPRKPSVWLADLADALVKLETVTPDRFDLAFLATVGIDAIRERVDQPLTDSITADPLAHEISDVLERDFRDVTWPGVCLVHQDFWPGNTVWRRERLSAIIDWSTAAVGDPRIDLAQCRVDLAMMYGTDMADAFLDVYQARSGAPVSDVWFFDLLCGVSALGEFRRWLVGYHDIGLPQLREDILEERLRTFLARAVARRRAGSPGPRAGPTAPP